MSHLFKLIALCTLTFVPLFGELVDTFYGQLTVEEPILLELIDSPAFQRLRNIHQYGVSYYLNYNEEYSRYDHSLGVFALLRMKGASLEEQVAGLLHDVSHTAFSHVSDWLYDKANQEEDYQNSIHATYLAASGLEEILKRHGYTKEQIDPNSGRFNMLEQPLPDLCADRIDYNIQGAYFQKFLTKEEARELAADLSFIDGRWVITRQDLAEKLAQFAIFMTTNCWGSAVNHYTSLWLAGALRRAMETGLVTLHELHFGCDDPIWEKLMKAKDPEITLKMRMVTNFTEYLALTTADQAEERVYFRCRAIDPWIERKGKQYRLTQLNPQLAAAFQKTVELAREGWPVRLTAVEAMAK